MIGRTIVVIPAFNASRTLPRLLDALITNVSRDDILVVNDGSNDDTAASARDHGVRCLSLERNGGKGFALSAAFRLVRSEKDIDSVITMDADLQHSPSDVPAFIRCRRETRANLVLGRRKVMGTAMPFTRRISNIVTSFLVSSRTGWGIRDSQCGFRLIGREVLDKVSMESDGYEAETEFLLKACRAGFTVASVPIQTVYDEEESHMTHWETTRRFVNILMKEI